MAKGFIFFSQHIYVGVGGGDGHGIDCNEKRFSSRKRNSAGFS